MYDWPEVRAETDAFWSAIRAGSGVASLPPGLTRPDDLESHWRDPGLVFSQCCWGPLSQGLIAVLEPLAQPDYSGFAGGRGPAYRSALVVRRDDGGADEAPVPDQPGATLPRAGLGGGPGGRRLAVNAPQSLSGCLALAADLGCDPGVLTEGCLWTGSHRDSVRAVAAGQADIAAIDCRSWALARRFEPCSAGLVVIGWTAERPGLPYVGSRASDPALRAALRRELLTRGCHPVPEGGWT